MGKSLLFSLSLPPLSPSPIPLELEGDRRMAMTCWQSGRRNESPCKGQRLSWHSLAEEGMPVSIGFLGSCHRPGLLHVKAVCHPPSCRTTVPSIPHQVGMGRRFLTLRKIPQVLHGHLTKQWPTSPVQSIAEPLLVPWATWSLGGSIGFCVVVSSQG